MIWNSFDASKLRKSFFAETLDADSLVHNSLRKSNMTNDTELQQLVSETKFVDPNYQFFKDNLTKEKQTSLR